MAQTAYKTDENSQESLISNLNQQVMMEWEKPYMEACIDVLQPAGDVLEIGFGCAYSANKIQSYNPKSHTIVECDSEVLKKLREWAKDKANVKIVEGRWQDVIHTLGVFDEIFMDDFPLDLDVEQANIIELRIKNNFRLHIFIDICLQNHTRIGSKISAYMNDSMEFLLSKRAKHCSSVETSFIDTEISSSCRYRVTGSKKCSVPLITKTSRFNLYEVLKNRYVIEWSIRELTQKTHSTIQELIRWP